jgi:hypothetical protein
MYAGVFQRIFTGVFQRTKLRCRGVSADDNLLNPLKFGYFSGGFGVVGVFQRG